MGHSSCMVGALDRPSGGRGGGGKRGRHYQLHVQAKQKPLTPRTQVPQAQWHENKTAWPIRRQEGVSAEPPWQLLAGASLGPAWVGDREDRLPVASGPPTPAEEAGLESSASCCLWKGLCLATLPWLLSTCVHTTPKTRPSNAQPLGTVHVLSEMFQTRTKSCSDLQSKDEQLHVGENY